MHIRAMTPQEFDPVVALLAESFQDDPGWTIVAPDPAARAAMLHHMMAEELRWAMAGHAEVLVATIDARSTELLGALAWEPTLGGGISPARFARGVMSGLAMAARRPRTTARCIRTLNAVDRHKPRDPVGYVAVLGCALRGQGVGKALMQAAVSPSIGIRDAYLETNNPVNVGIYERMGYVVTRHMPALFRSGPAAWWMRRDKSLAWGQTAVPIGESAG